MADSKVTQLPSLVTPASEDLLLIIDDPSGTPVSKQVDLLTLLGSLPANTVINGTFTVNSNTVLAGSNVSVSANVTFSAARPIRVNSGAITLGARASVASNNATTQLGSGGMQGTVFWDADYLYVATSNTEIKRVALSTWNS